MTVDTIGAATRTFAATVEGVLLRLETRLREHGAASGLPVIRTSETGSGVDRAQQAKVDAASAIFAAERDFSAACLREISAKGGEVPEVLEPEVTALRFRPHRSLLAHAATRLLGNGRKCPLPSVSSKTEKE